MSTTTAPDVDTIAHLDFEYEVPCNRGACATGEPARWKATRPLCGHVNLWCSPCRQVWIEWLRAADRNGSGRLRCGTACDFTLPAPACHLAIRVEPL